MYSFSDMSVYMVGCPHERERERDSNAGYYLSGVSGKINCVCLGVVCVLERTSTAMSRTTEAARPSSIEGTAARELRAALAGRKVVCCGAIGASAVTEAAAPIMMGRTIAPVCCREIPRIKQARTFRAS